jgi:hypothetical protein
MTWFLSRMFIVTIAGESYRRAMLGILLGVATSLRITAPIGHPRYIPQVSGRDLISFLNTHQLVIIFYTDSVDSLDFATFAINKYSNFIAFAIAPPSEGSGRPIVPYRNGKILPTYVAPTSPIGFTVFCKNIIRPLVTRATHPEILRQVFDTPGTYFLGVGMKERPTDLPNEYPFIAVEPDVFASFRVEIPPGLYVYRSSDRQLTKVTGKVTRYLKSVLVDIMTVNLTDKPFYGGYFLNEQHPFSVQANALLELAKKHKNVHWSLFAGDTAEYLASAAGMLYVATPYLTIFRSNESERNHWFVTNLSVVPDILEGRVDYLPATGVKFNQTTLVFTDYDEVVGQVAGDRIVLFTANDKFSNLGRAFFALQEKVDAPNLHFFTYSIRQNEFPLGVQLEKVPAIVLYPEGKDLIVYDGEPSLQDLIHFVMGETTNEFPYPATEREVDSAL